MPSERAFIVRQDRPIAPFGEPARNALVNHLPLSAHQRNALLAAGFVPVPVPTYDAIPVNAYPCLALTDDLYFSAHTIRAFVTAARRRSGTGAQAHLDGRTAYARILGAVQERADDGMLRYPLHYLHGPSERAGAAPVAIDVAERPLPFLLPPHMRGEGPICVPGTTRPLVRIVHAAHILSANISALLLPLVDATATPWRRLLLALRAGSTQPVRALSTLNRIGRNCDIHPTACLEGAIVGDNVRIGANAVVRLSHIGDGCEIGDNAAVRLSVVGPGSVLFDDLSLGFSVCYPNVFLIHGPYHLSVFGRDSAMFATILTDFRLDGKPIQIETDGKLEPIGFPFLGSFIGHRTRVGGGSIIAPGRVIPNDLLIFPAPASVLTRLDPDLPTGTPLAIQDGRLSPIRKT
jgi:acetyltransferase-like isoleucine patch superfamily enzyme